MIRQFLSNTVTSGPSPFEVEKTPEMIAEHRSYLIANAVSNLMPFMPSAESSSQTASTPETTAYTTTPAAIQKSIADNATVAGEVVLTAEQHYDTPSIESLRNTILQNSTSAGTQARTFADSEGRVG